MVLDHLLRRGARVVEGNGLENRRASNGTEGSNPSLSAIEMPRLIGRGFSIGYVERPEKAFA